ncbi:unnamed protein product, partial [Phaeothamnion confervicola]
MAAAVASVSPLSYTGGSGTLTKPSGTVDGDWLFLAASLDGTTSSTLTFGGATLASLGWTQIDVSDVSAGGVDNNTLRIYKKQASGEPASWAAATSSGNASFLMARCTSCGGVN